MVLLETVQLIHNIGIAWGVGGATISFILMMKSEKDPSLAPHIMKLMPAISKLTGIAIILLIISGVALVPLITWPMDTMILTVKHIVVLILIINGVYLAAKLLPKMKKLAKDGKPSLDFLKTKKNVKVSGLTGLILWYLILVLSVIM